MIDPTKKLDIQLENLDPEVAEWLREVVLKDEYYDIPEPEDTDFDERSA